MPDQTPGRLPLKNVCVLITRPKHQAQHLAALVEREGGEALCFPVIEIVEPTNNSALLQTIDRLADFDLAIFISPNAVSRSMGLINTRGGLPPTLQIACVGRGSARELKRFGIENPIVPEGRADSEALLELPALQETAGKKIVIFRGDGGRALLGDTLRERGAQIEYAECYRRVRPDADITPILRRWERGRIDIVSITSVTGLRNLYGMVGAAGRQWLIKTPIVVVSQRQASVCRDLGFKTEPLVAGEAGDEAILEAIKTWRCAQNSL